MSYKTDKQKRSEKDRLEILKLRLLHQCGLSHLNYILQMEALMNAFTTINNMFNKELNNEIIHIDEKTRIDHMLKNLEEEKLKIKD